MTRQEIEMELTGVEPGIETTLAVQRMIIEARIEELDKCMLNLDSKPEVILRKRRIEALTKELEGEK